jgi:hypothetical protein
MALGSTQPLTDEYQEYFLGVKSAGARGLTTFQPSCADCLKKSGNFKLLEPSRPVMELLCFFTYEYFSAIFQYVAILIFITPLQVIG